MAHASAWSRVQIRVLLTNLLRDSATLPVGDFSCDGHTEKGSAVSDFGPHSSHGVSIKRIADPIILPYTRWCCLIHIHHGASTHYHVYRCHLYLRQHRSP